MFRVGLLIRAIPSILAELVALCWYSYRTGDRRMAAAALIWLSSTTALVAFTVAAVLTAVQGGEVQLRGPALAASVPIAMWIARELIGIVLLLAGRLLALFGQGPADARYG